MSQTESGKDEDGSTVSLWGKSLPGSGSIAPPLLSVSGK